jgi:hypothetical protein
MYINFTIYNFGKDPTFWYKLKSFRKQLSKNKHLEIETVFSNYNLLSFEFDCTLRGKDHAGIRLKLNFCGLELEIHFYDSRHWDYKNQCWEVNSAEEMTKNNLDGF